MGLDFSRNPDTVAVYDEVYAVMTGSVVHPDYRGTRMHMKWVPDKAGVNGMRGFWHHQEKLDDGSRGPVLKAVFDMKDYGTLGVDAYQVFETVKTASNEAFLHHVDTVDKYLPYGEPIVDFWYSRVRDDGGILFLMFRRECGMVSGQRVRAFGVMKRRKEDKEYSSSDEPTCLSAAELDRVADSLPRL